MSDLMEDLMYVRTYLDDLLIITSGSLSDHLAMLDPVLGRLRDAGLKVNALKSFFCTEETEYLRYVLTRDYNHRKYRRFSRLNLHPMLRS